MADNKEKYAFENYKLVCKVLDELEINYKKDDERLSASFLYQDVDGEKYIPDFYINARQQLIVLNVYPEFKIRDDNILPVAIAVCQINYGVVDGYFDLNVAEGDIAFKMTSNFWDSLLSGEVIKQMLMVGINTAKDWFATIKKISDGELDVNVFLFSED